MALEEHSSSSDGSSEQSREAFVQQAVMYAERTYALEQELTKIQIGNAAQRKTNEPPNTSQSASRRRIVGHPAVAHKSQSANTGLVLSPATQQFVKQLETLGLERRQMPQLCKAVNHEMKQAIEYFSSEAPEAVQSEQLTSPAPPTGRSATSLALTRRGQFAAIPSRTSANVIQGVRTSMPEVSTGPQGSPEYNEMDRNSNACPNGSSFADGPKSRARKASTGRQLPICSKCTAKQSAASTKADVARTSNPARQSLPSDKGSQSKRSTSKLPSHAILSHAQLELEIQKIMQVASGNQGKKLSDADFDHIAEILLQANREEWSYRPRTYVLLKMINAVNLMDDFVKDECLDIALPYVRGNVPKSLSPEQRDHFLKKQESVMTETASIEGGLKAKHANFADSADNHLETLGPLAEGGYGKVDKIRSKLSRKIYARKRLERQETFEQSAEALKLFKREVDHLKKLKHRHLVRYIGSYTDPQYVGIIMDPLAEKDLSDFLNQSEFKPAEYVCIREAFGCLCSAIIYLQSQNVRHKDIKPQNILVNERKMFITDFGLALDWKTLSRSTTKGPHGPITDKYAPPEVMDNKSRNSSADIWSLGCVYLDMITVLKGETSLAKSAYFLDNGDCNLIYSRNLGAFKGWLKKLESKKYNAPLDWIRNMTMIKPESRLKPQQLMDRILCSDDENDYYGLCCDGKIDDDVAVELRNSDIEDSSGSEDTSDDRVPAKKAHDSAVVEKQLCKAAAAQDVKMLKKWLRKVLHMRNRGLKTKAIHYAAANGNEEITNILISFGCKLEYTFNGHTPLSSAIQASREGTTELLAKTKIAINARSPSSQSALHLATSRPFHAGMRILLGAGALVDIRDQYQSTPLQKAAIAGNLLSVKILLENGADPSLHNSLGLNALQQAAGRGFKEIVRTLLDHGAEIDAYDASCPTRPYPALATAVFYNKPMTVELLLQRGANVNIQTSLNDQISPSPIHLAAGKRLVQVVDILLQHKPNLELRDSQNQTPLLIACRQLDSKIVERLLTAGADVRTEDKSLDKMIQDLLRTKNFPILQLLIDNGASLEKRDPLLHGAAASGEVEIINFLLKNHVKVDVQNSRNLTSLMAAAEYKQEESVQVLVKNGASINTQNHWGNTALHFAVVSNCPEIVSFLLEHGSDALLYTKDGFTALSLARRHNHEDIYELISKALDIAGRIVYDRRWPGYPLYLSLDDMQYGYNITNYNGTPWIRNLRVEDRIEKTRAFDLDIGSKK